MSQGRTKMARGEGRLRSTALHPLCRSVSAKMLADAALHVEFPEHAHGQPWAEIHAQVIPSSKSTRRQEGLATGPCSSEDTQTDSEAELLIGGRTARKWLNRALDPARGGVLWDNAVCGHTSGGLRACCTCAGTGRGQQDGVIFRIGGLSPPRVGASPQAPGLGGGVFEGPWGKPGDWDKPGDWLRRWLSGGVA